MAFNQNVLRKLDKIMKSRYPNENFNDVEALNNVIKKPNIIRRLRSVLQLIIEINTKWVINEEGNLVELYKTACYNPLLTVNGSAVIRPIDQTYGYMKLNRLKYSALSTYDLTWFFRLSGKGGNTLHISNPIKIDSTAPTLFQCLVYLMSRGRSHPKPSIDDLRLWPRPHSPNPNSDADDDDSAGNEEDATNNGPRRGNTSGNGSAAAGDNYSEKLPETVNMGPLDFDEFDIICPLGTGRSGRVFKAFWHGEEVALKICDIAQQPEYKEELITEVEVYNSLIDLQGHYIPRLRDAGFVGEIIFALAIEVAGSPIDVDQLNYTERQKVVEALSEIHRRGFLHNDIRSENILIQRDDDGFKVSFIDFAFSRYEPSESLRSEEMATLKDLLGVEEERVPPKKRQQTKKKRHQRKQDLTKKSSPLLKSPNNSQHKRSTEPPESPRRKVRVLRGRTVYSMSDCTIPNVSDGR